MKMQHVIHFVCAVLLLIAPASFAQAVNYDVPLFNSADLPNRPFFRAPVLLSAPDGSLLAFGEAREKIDDPGRGDGLSDIIMKMSLDGGQRGLPSAPCIPAPPMITPSRRWCWTRQPVKFFCILRRLPICFSATELLSPKVTAPTLFIIM